MEGIVLPAVISAAVYSVVETLISKALDVCRGDAHLQEELEFLKVKVNNIRSILEDAECKQSKNDAVRAWLGMLKDIAYDAEDLLDGYVTDVATRQITEDNQLGLTKKIKSINNRFDRVLKEIKRLDLHTAGMPNKGNSISAQVRQSSSLMDVDWPIIGRDDVKDEIIKQLISNEVENNTTKLPVLPIVGMGGVGKTSLAQLVFNDSEVKAHFPLTIWVFVSQDFDPCKILRSIIESIYVKSGKGKSCELTSLESLQNEIRGLIEKGKFLLILDDVWNEEQCLWEQLLTPLKFGENGSKVLVTARSKIVVKYIDGHMSPINLEGMDNENIWKILAWGAFKGVADLVDYEELKDMGMQIVKKLTGSPLAAKTIGRLLGINLDKNHWTTILESDLWEVRGQKAQDIMPSLWLSYQYLPPILKNCFSLCSLFRKGQRIPKEKLSYIWIAHGIFPVEHNITPENSAAEAIQDLISMSLLSQGMDKDIVIMHDLIHDVSKFVSREDHLYIKDKIIPEEHPPKLRHLSFSDMNWKFFSERNWESKLPCDKLRSVLCTNEYLILKNIGETALNGWLNQSKCLRVLDLHGYPVQVLPNSIGNLKHLRYLNVSRTGVSELPKSLTSLYNLQALWLEGCRRLKKLPDGMGNLVNMRCLNVSRTGVSELPKSLTSLYNLQALWLEDCHWLNRLPDGMGNLVNLRLLKAPKSLLTATEGIGRLSNLQNLRFFDVDPKNGWGIEELDNLGSFRGELTIRFLENVLDIDKARKASMQRKKYLQRLTLQWTKDCVVSSETAERVLEALQPNVDGLKHLKIINFGGRVPPSWLTTGYHFPSLIELELVNWKSCADFGPIIRNLNNFERLELWSGGNLVCRGNASLREVRIEDGKKLLSLHLPTSVEEVDIDGYLAKDESLMTSLRGMTSLRRLSLVHSPDLSEVLEKEVVISLLQRSLQRYVLNPGFYVCFGKDSESNWEMKIRPFKGLLLSFVVKVSSTSGRWVWELLQHIASHLGQYVQELMFTCPDEEIVKDGELEELFVPLNNLSKLEFHRCCESLTSLPSDMTRLTSLQSLELRECPKIESLADIGLPASLQQLEIEYCESLTSLPSDMRGLTSLQRLRLWKCPKIESLADISLPASLQQLEIVYCESLTSLPSDMTRLTSLQSLSLYECPKIESLADIGLPDSLQQLHILRCESLTSLPSDMTGLPASLQQLKIEYCWSLTSLPSDMTRLTSLQKLELFGCSMLQSFPESGLPPSLSTLEIWNCPKLQSFPESGLPPSLSTLLIYNCPALEEKYRSGPERALLISHIPRVDWK